MLRVVHSENNFLDIQSDEEDSVNGIDSNSVKHVKSSLSAASSPSRSSRRSPRADGTGTKGLSQFPKIAPINLPPPEVNHDEFVQFDEATHTFRLNAGCSTYAFRVNDVGDVEHLYHGTRLNPYDDLSYVDRANVQQPFDPSIDISSTIERRKIKFEQGSVLGDVSVQDADLFETWKSNRGALGPISTRESSLSIDSESMTKRRMENLSWRMLGMEALGATSPAVAPSKLLEGDLDIPSLSLGSCNATNIAQVSHMLNRDLSEVPVSSEYDGDTKTKSGKNTTRLEYSDAGTGDYRVPSISVVYDQDGSSISPLTYAGHRIYDGMPGLGVPREMPRPRVGKSVGDKCDTGEDACTTLVIVLVDDVTGMRVELVYTVFHYVEVILRKVIVSNAMFNKAEKLTIHKVMSATVDFEATQYTHWLTQLSGSWARERQRLHRQLDHGITSFGSTRGTSSHQHNPFVVISQGAAVPHESTGDVFGMALMYSGNFLCEAEVTDVGRLRVNIGIHPEGFRWTLSHGERFHSPTVVMGFSNQGMGRLSRLFHRFVKERVIHPKWVKQPCPILLNSWEALYFDVNHESIVSMAKAASELGMEMLVLDDGWFGKRDDATTSLGDWEPDLRKFPLGLKALVDDVNELGVKFGLWIEPEMLSVESELYQLHPDWCLHVPKRPTNQGRNQLVLDMSRKEVREHIFEMIGKTLRECNIEYVKWDMNRSLTEVYSVALPAQHQGEVAHRYCMGVYDLHRMFTEGFPDIRFEGCSGGGGRFDLGILYYTPQIWASDNTDALMRLKIQHGTSYFAPCMSVGSHYSTIPNHITQGVSRKRTRALVAMCGTYGFELDPRSISSNEAFAVMEHIRIFKEHRRIIHHGDLYRLWDPFNINYCAWMYVLRPERARANAGAASKPITAADAPAHGEEREEALVFAFNMSSQFWSSLAPRLFLRGLNSRYVYHLTEPLPNNRMQLASNAQIVKTKNSKKQLTPGMRLGGDTLMHSGLPVKFFTGDDSMLIHLKHVDTMPPPPPTPSPEY